MTQSFDYNIELPLVRGVPVTACNVQQACRECPVLKESVLNNGPKTTASGLPIFRDIVYDKRNSNNQNSSFWGLRFDSNFENGNLEKAEWIRPKSESDEERIEFYHLYLTPDVACVGDNNQQCSQCFWFFFNISNIRKGRQYRFLIKNMTARRTSYHSHVVDDRSGSKRVSAAGVCVLASSAPSKTAQSPSWTRDGAEITYLPTDGTDDQTLFTLSFTLRFNSEYDSAYVAYSLPYTYTHLQNFIHNIMSNDTTNKHVESSILCRTFDGNKCELLRITDDKQEFFVPPSLRMLKCAAAQEPSKTTTSGPKKVGDSKSEAFIPPALRRIAQVLHNDKLERLMAELNKLRLEFEQHKWHAKPVIVVSGRLGAGDGASSFIVEGMIRFLLSADSTAEYLRQHFAFYIIPMCNVDGVVRGSYRTDGSGVDLAHNWKSPAKGAVTFYIRELLKRLKTENRLMGFIDLHSHAFAKGISVLSCRQTGDRLARCDDLKQQPSEIIRLSLASSAAQITSSFINAAARLSRLTNLDACNNAWIRDLPTSASASARRCVFEDFQCLCLSIAASSYWGPQLPYSMKYLTAYDYLRYGKVICKAIADSFKLIIVVPPIGESGTEYIDSKANRDSIEKEGKGQYEAGFQYSANSFQTYYSGADKMLHYESDIDKATIAGLKTKLALRKHQLLANDARCITYCLLDSEEDNDLYAHDLVNGLNSGDAFSGISLEGKRANRQATINTSTGSAISPSVKEPAIEIVGPTEQAFIAAHCHLFIRGSGNSSAKVEAVFESPDNTWKSQAAESDSIYSELGRVSNMCPIRYSFQPTSRSKTTRPRRAEINVFHSSAIDDSSRLCEPLSDELEPFIVHMTSQRSKDIAGVEVDESVQSLSPNRTNEISWIHKYQNPKLQDQQHSTSRSSGANNAAPNARSQHQSSAQANFIASDPERQLFYGFSIRSKFQESSKNETIGTISTSTATRLSLETRSRPASGSMRRSTLQKRMCEQPTTDAGGADVIEVDHSIQLPLLLERLGIRSPLACSAGERIRVAVTDPDLDTANECLSVSKESIAISGTRLTIDDSDARSVAVRTKGHLNNTTEAARKSLIVSIGANDFDPMSVCIPNNVSDASAESSLAVEVLALKPGIAFSPRPPSRTKTFIADNSPRKTIINIPTKPYSSLEK